MERSSVTYKFKKKKNGIYLDCNDAFAELAQLDSPEQIRGMRDRQLPWRYQEEFFLKLADEVCRCQTSQIRNQFLFLHQEIKLIHIQLTPKRPPLQQQHGLVDCFQGEFGFLHWDTDAIKGDRFFAFKRILTMNEQDIVKLTAFGNSAKEIGRILCLSHRTVEKYLENIKAQFCFRSKRELVAFYINEILIQEMLLSKNSVDP